jgi:hypothetical protein
VSWAARASPTSARAGLEALRAEVRGRPDVALRRQLWADLLAQAYGTSVDQDDHFFQQAAWRTLPSRTTVAAKEAGRCRRASNSARPQRTTSTATGIP